jgi:heme ABC exporter ATP-binding subunit CcmA
LEPTASAAPVWAVEVERLFKSFGHLAVLRGLDLRVRAGERLLLVGPNGSGKTTLLKILATLLRPNGGRARVCGFDVRRDAADVRRCVGVLSHQTYLYGELTALENLTFYADMYAVPNRDRRARDLLRQVGLERRAKTQVRTLSRGMQQRLAVARALLHRPAVLLLDEPDTGLDQRAAAVLGDLLSAASAEGSTVVLTSHNLERGLALADRVAVLTGGRITFEAAKEELHAGDLERVYHRVAGTAG